MRRALERVYLFAAVQLSDVEGVERDRLVMRVTARCNERCPFCQAELCICDEDPSLERLCRAADRMAAALPDCQVILTGGEPTLREDLGQLCAHIVSNPRVAALEVQTNAVLIGRHPARYAWPDSTKLRFLVALHGFEPDVYDACTGTKGLLADALGGLRHLLGCGYEVEINFVATALNADRLTGAVERVAALFPGRPRPRLHFSVLGIPEHRQVTDLHVAYEDLVQAFDAALDRADELDVPCVVALSASHARIPPCFLSAFPRLSRLPVPLHEHGAWEGGTGDWWTKPAACGTCRDRDRCMGIPRSYASKFGRVDVYPLADDSES
ncbi:MAG: radical SAM protein [Myxococcota bacterium]